MHSLVGSNDIKESDCVYKNLSSTTHMWKSQLHYRHYGAKWFEYESTSFYSGTVQGASYIANKGMYNGKCLERFLEKINKILHKNWCLFIDDRCLARKLSCRNKHWCLRKNWFIFVSASLGSIVHGLSFVFNAKFFG
jgi:hypothetical protein